jgi:hypothetical protein
MYLPCFVFPYQRDPRLWYTPVSVLIHTKPAAFAGSVCGFAEDAGAVAAGDVEGEAEGAEVGFAELGAAIGVVLSCDLSALPGCGDCARRVETLTTAVVTTSTKATSRARDGFFALRFIVLLLAEMRAHWNAGALESRHDGEETRSSQYGRRSDLLANGPVNGQSRAFGAGSDSTAVSPRRSECGNQSAASALRARGTSTDSANPRRTGPSTNAGTSRSGASERLVALRGNSVR